MQRFNLEVTVGLFVALGLLALGYLSIKLGGVQIGGGSSYTLTAVFPTVAGLKPGAPVEIAGVQVGRVERIRLQNYEAVVTLRLDAAVPVQEDAIVSIKTRGLIGEKYVRITPGAAERTLPPGGRIREVETPLDFEDIIAQFIQGKL
ncbi:MAG: outer membrane lipid asymmetry maintenance protein MlaD [Candidatus Tectimicrobiota bacterium]|nr:MAG: outer membrane lipid asymmetry maintenance protein MlaD [Candidatus Tectomicrobia bacterium]